MGIAKHLAREQHQIGLSVADDLVGLSRRGDQADRSGGDIRFAANSFREWRLISGPHGDVRLFEIPPRRAIDHVNAKSEQKAREFQYTTPGQALLDILDNRNLEVELIAPSRWLSWLKTGYGFQVRVEETDKVYPARITRLGGRVDPVSQSIKVIGVITGEAPELTAGMSGRAIILPPS